MRLRLLDYLRELIPKRWSPPKRWGPPFCLALAISLSSVSLGGCSLGMFGSGQDAEVRDSTGYREIRNACSGIELSGPSLDVASFRGLLRCFNSNGALDPLDRLVSALSDEQLDPIVTTLNKSVLNNKTLLYKLESTHQLLSDRGLLDSTLYQLGRLTENEEFVASAIALLKEGYFSGSSGGPLTREPDRQLLRALEKIAGKLSHKNIEEGIDTALNLGTSKSFLELQKRFKYASPSGRSLMEITEKVLEHLRDFKDPNHVQVGRELISSVINGDLFQALDEVVGTSAEDLRRGIPRLSAVLRVSFANDGRIFKGLTSLFHFARKRLECVNGGATVADPAFFILGELSQVAPENAASFLKRDNLLNLATMNPFCRFPAELASGYPMLMAFADTNAIRPATETIQAFYRIVRDGDRPMARLLLNLLADTGSAYPGAPAEDSAGIKRLTPLLAEMDDRKAWDDMLLVANLVDVQYRKKLSDFLIFLTEPASELGGKSIYDVFTGVILRTHPVDLYHFVHSLRRFTAEDEPLLAPALTSLRSAYYANDVHPMFDLAQQIMADASSNERFFSTLFLISEMPEFRESLRLISSMSKDGRLKTLLGSLLAVFHKSAQEGFVNIRETTEPPFVPKRRHNLSSADLVPFELAPEPSTANHACLKIKLGIDLGDHSHPDHEAQLRNVIECMNSSGSHGDVEEALDFLTREKVSDGRSALAYQIDLIRQLELSKSQSNFLIETWKNEYDGGRFFRLLDAVPFWLRKTDAEQPAISELILKALKPVVPSGLESLDRLGKFGARVLRDKEFPRLLGYVDRLIPPEAETKAAQSTQPEDHLDAIAESVGAQECEANPERRSARAKEIVQDYRDSITSWELVNGKQRRSWKRDDFKKTADRITGKLADPSQSATSKNLLSSLLEFMKFYSLEPGATPDSERHESPEYLGQWIKQRSGDFQLIPYYFTDERGKIKRRMRLVNSLDRFELVLINSDFKAPVIGKNFGLQFLAQIGEAWGDEPRENWPAEIQKKYKKDKRPQTLREAFKDIAKTQRLFERLMGFPKVEKCATSANVSEIADIPETPEQDDDSAGLEADPELQSFLSEITGDGRKKIQASLYNIRQVLPVIEQNLPGSGHPVFNGGMKVFRDLFYQIYYSTPEDFKGARAGDSNNLSFVMWVARMGAARQMGRLFFNGNRSASEQKEFFEALVEGSTAEGIEPALRSLLTQPKHSLIWAALDPILALPDQETAELKSAVFDLVMASRQLDVISKSVAIFPSVLKDFRETLTEHVGWTLEKFRSPRVSGFLRALYLSQEKQTKEDLQRIIHAALDEPGLATDGLLLVKGISDVPEARQAWAQTWDRIEMLKKHPEYPYPTVKSVVRDVIRFFSEGYSDPLQPSPSGQSRDTASKLRFYAADRLDKADLLPMLELATANPAEFNQVLATMSRHLENGDLQQFFGLIRRGLSQGR